MKNNPSTTVSQPTTTKDMLKRMRRELGKPSKNKNIDSEDLLKVIAILLQGGNWFQISKSYFHIMTRDESLVLGYLQSHENTLANNKHYQRNNRWFFCLVLDITKDLNMSEYTQARIISSLEKNGFIETKRKGVPPKRYIRIKWAHIAKKVYQSLKKEHEKDITNP